MTFIALVNSLEYPMRPPDYTVGAPHPECLNRMTSRGDDSLKAGRIALLNARQTAILVTA
jgi:hypothetical protein